MTKPLVLPDGVRLPLREEIKGPRAERDRLWAQVERAVLHQGFVARPAGTPEFAWFIEANVDADRLFELFVLLVETLFGSLPLADASFPASNPQETGNEGPVCQLLLSDADEELTPVVSAPLGRILPLLAEIQYQLAHDGWIQFGLVRETEGRVVGLLVTPTKHLQIWAQNREEVAGLLRSHGLAEDTELTFLASYPVIVDTPPDPPEELRGAEDLRAALLELLEPDAG